ncbi:hypothetical protein G2W53_034693 [Senna tora]|uniref:Uncharacterized protein n=1 Tax=Senna tora TaxID=362788 RepID=A0A834T2A2_9FABA|nr:hypothetical protein G2W53_034693 [Senna tora]
MAGGFDPFRYFVQLRVGEEARASEADVNDGIGFLGVEPTQAVSILLAHHAHRVNERSGPHVPDLASHDFLVVARVIRFHLNESVHQTPVALQLRLSELLHQLRETVARFGVIGKLAPGHRNRVGKTRDGKRFVFGFGSGSECSDGFYEGSGEDAEAVEDESGDADAEGEVGGPGEEGIGDDAIGRMGEHEVLHAVVEEVEDLEEFEDGGEVGGEEEVVDDVVGREGNGVEAEEGMRRGGVRDNGGLKRESIGGGGEDGHVVATCGKETGELEEGEHVAGSEEGDEVDFQRGKRVGIIIGWGRASHIVHYIIHYEFTPTRFDGACDFAQLLVGEEAGAYEANVEHRVGSLRVEPTQAIFLAHHRLYVPLGLLFRSFVQKRRGAHVPDLEPRGFPTRNGKRTGFGSIFGWESDAGSVEEEPGDSQAGGEVGGPGVEDVGDDAVGRVLVHEVLHLGAEESHSVEDFGGGAEVVDGDEIVDAVGEADMVRREGEVVEMKGKGRSMGLEEGFAEEGGGGRGGEDGHVVTTCGEETKGMK